jgi:hypothetical protein
MNFSNFNNFVKKNCLKFKSLLISFKNKFHKLMGKNSNKIFRFFKKNLIIYIGLLNK